jgi:hypothetical protein
MQCGFVVPIRIEAYVGLFDNEHCTARTHDQIQLTRSELLELKGFPVHHVFLTVFPPDAIETRYAADPTISVRHRTDDAGPQSV